MAIGIRSLLLVLALALGACAGTTGSTPSVTYRCPSGRTVEAVYRSETKATVRYDGKVHEMTVAASGSGARYVGGGLEWWTRGTGPGSEGMILHHNADGTPGNPIELCTHVSG